MFLPCSLSVSNQGRTKDEARNNQRTPKHQKVLFIKMAVSFTTLIPCLVFTERTPKDDRRKTERTPRQQKVLFLKMGSNKVVPIPKKVAPKYDFYLHVCKKVVPLQRKLSKISTNIE